MKLLAAMAVLGLAAPAFAVEKTTAVALDDTQLDQVAAGCDTGTTGGALTPVTNTNINVSPIVVNQTAVALSMQNANVHGKGKGLVKQNASNAAVNYAFINYHVKY
jgi:hypothetical protein